MTPTEATIVEFIWVPFFLPIFDGNIRILTIVYKQKWTFLLRFLQSSMLSFG